MLQQIDVDRLEQRAAQMALHGRINHAYRRLQEYLRSKHTWGARHASVLGARPVAYFSAEFGLHESMPIYSGGLGILAGDHLKSASDLGIPLVGIGLYYDQGYFRQRLDRDGWQHEEYIDVDHRLLPIQPAMHDGMPVTVEIDTRTGRIGARVWQTAVGRTTLILLDSNMEGNSPEDRELTARLYGGDQRVRIRQELLLGIGGVKALAALGISPGVIHLNEGHSAFAALELIRCRMEAEGVGVDEATRRVGSQVVFTTHTPVPAGHDRFSPDLIEEHLGPVRDGLGLAYDAFLALGRVNPYDPREEFCMTVLALKCCHRANAVSSLHGQVSRTMWMPLFPGVRDEQIPIGHVTNGVHVNTWLAPQMRLVYDRHLGANWVERSGDPALWDAIDEIDDGELWEAHQALKASLIEVTRRRVVRASVCHLQASQPAPAGSRVTRRTAQSPADARAARLRREVASVGRSRKDRAAGSGPSGPRPAVHGKDRVHRGLRHQRRPASRPGCRRLAEQSPSSARSLRDERAESGAQWRAEPVGARWLVGGGLRRTERVCDRPR
jgi:starch phosphorylase